MKFKYLLITIGSMLLLLGLLNFATPSSGRDSYRSSPDKSTEIIISLIGLGTLLTGIFWKKQ